MYSSQRKTPRPLGEYTSLTMPPHTGRYPLGHPSISGYDSPASRKKRWIVFVNRQGGLLAAAAGAEVVASPPTSSATATNELPSLCDSEERRRAGMGGTPP